MSNARRIIVIAGPNGAGKTTFAREFLPVDIGLVTYVNADLIAAGLSPFAPEEAAIKAGRLMLAQISEYVQAGKSFAFETTLSGRSYARLIPQWRQQAGYRVELIFLRLPSPVFAQERVAQRVRQGGHHVPAEVVERRFYAGRRNFESLYKPLVDTWMDIDTSVSPFEIIDWKEA